MRRWRGSDFQIYPVLLLINRIASEDACQCSFLLWRASSSINYGTTSDERSDDPPDLFHSPRRRVQVNYPTAARIVEEEGRRRKRRNQTCQVKRQITHGVLHSRPRREKKSSRDECVHRKWRKKGNERKDRNSPLSSMGKHQHRSTRISNSVLKFIWPSPLNRRKYVRSTGDRRWRLSLLLFLQFASPLCDQLFTLFRNAQHRPFILQFLPSFIMAYYDVLYRQALKTADATVKVRTRWMLPTVLILRRWLLFSH